MPPTWAGTKYWNVVIIDSKRRERAAGADASSCELAARSHFVDIGARLLAATGNKLGLKVHVYYPTFKGTDVTSLAGVPARLMRQRVANGVAMAAQLAKDLAAGCQTCAAGTCSGFGGSSPDILLFTGHGAVCRNNISELVPEGPANVPPPPVAGQYYTPISLLGCESNRETGNPFAAWIFGEHLAPHPIFRAKITAIATCWSGWNDFWAAPLIKDRPHDVVIGARVQLSNDVFSWTVANFVLCWGKAFFQPGDMEAAFRTACKSPLPRPRLQETFEASDSHPTIYWRAANDPALKVMTFPWRQHASTSPPPAGYAESLTRAIASGPNKLPKVTVL